MQSLRHFEKLGRALAVQQRFAEGKGRDEAVRKWKDLEQWLVRGGPFSDEPLLKHDQLERAVRIANSAEKRRAEVKRKSRPGKFVAPVRFGAAWTPSVCRSPPA